MGQNSKFECYVIFDHSTNEVLLDLVDGSDRSWGYLDDELLENLRESAKFKTRREAHDTCVKLRTLYKNNKLKTELTVKKLKSEKVVPVEAHPTEV